MIEINDKRLRDYTFADLFCGIGRFHLALSSFGARCVFASDIDANVRLVYENNFHVVPKGDITSIHLNDIPIHDILCVGFPCQPFSILGQQKGFDDEKGRGKLFYEIIGHLSKSEPPRFGQRQAFCYNPLSDAVLRSLNLDFKMDTKFKTA